MQARQASRGPGCHPRSFAKKHVAWCKWIGWRVETTTNHGKYILALPKGTFESMIFPFPRWSILVPQRVIGSTLNSRQERDTFYRGLWISCSRSWFCKAYLSELLLSIQIGEPIHLEMFRANLFASICNLSIGIDDVHSILTWHLYIRCLQMLCHSWISWKTTTFWNSFML